MPILFRPESGTFDNRFVLRFTNPNLGISNPILNQNAVIIYKNSEQQMVVNSSVKKIKNIQIFDTLGRLLWVQKNANSNQVIVKNTISNSIIYILVELTDNQIISKKFSN